MEDSRIVQLYWDREQDAILETANKYGGYCTSIANNILDCLEDAEECVNDTYLHAWNAMPPHRPKVLSTFLGKITRNLSFNKYQHIHAQKRGGGEITLVLEELEDCVSGSEDVEQKVMEQELVKAIDLFLSRLPLVKRQIFVCRYWYADSVSDIAKRFKMTENSVSVTLSRTRGKLKAYLLERGFAI